MANQPTDLDDDNIFRETTHKLQEAVAPMVEDKVCKYCQASFSLKSSCKRHEALCKSNKERNAPIFSCLICKREFHRKQNLKRHVKTCQTKTATNTAVLSCKFCHFNFSNKRNRLEHEKICNANSDKHHPALQCCHCESVFHKKFSLIRHLRKCSATKPLPISKTPCFVKYCSDSFYRKTDLIHHVSHHHKSEISIKPKISKTFSSVEEFMKWKEEEEENTFSYFSLKRGKSSKGTQHFYCQHDGSAKLHSKRKTSKQRNLGRIKVGHYCISKMRLSVIDNQTFNLEYYPTHSHALKQEDQQHHPIPAKMSKFIDSKLSEKLPPDVVFELAKEHFTPKNNKTLHKSRADNLTRKLVYARKRRRHRQSHEENFYNFETLQNLETCEEQNDSNHELSGEESSNSCEKRKKVLWQKLKRRLDLFHAFMDQDPENVSEQQMLLLDTAFDALEPTLISVWCSAVAVPLVEPSIKLEFFRV